MPRRTTRDTAKAKRVGRRPVLLQHDVRAHLLDLVSEGNHINAACALAGIHPATIYRWLDRAEEADQQHDTPGAPPLDDVQHVYREFRDALAVARARAQKTAVDVVRTAMRGGSITSEKPLLGLDGDPLRNDDGEILYERSYTAPDGRLAMTFLARTAPDMWGQNATVGVELTGKDGGPVQVQQIEQQVPQVAARVAEVVARRRADLERDALEAAEDDVTDAEIVDE